MRLKQALVLGIAGMALHASAVRADVIAHCNYDFDVGPGVYDRGSVELMKVGTALSLQFVEDDELTHYDHVKGSSATGDQARKLIKDNSNFSKFVQQARIFPDQIVQLDSYEVPPAVEAPDSSDSDVSKSPQAQFFVFYGADQRYLGGFGIFDKTPFVCDWVEQN